MYHNYRKEDDGYREKQKRQHRKEGGREDYFRTEYSPREAYSDRGNVYTDDGTSGAVYPDYESRGEVYLPDSETRSGVTNSYNWTREDPYGDGAYGKEYDDYRSREEAYDYYGTDSYGGEAYDASKTDYSGEEAFDDDNRGKREADDSYRTENSREKDDHTSRDDSQAVIDKVMYEDYTTEVSLPSKETVYNSHYFYPHQTIFSCFRRRRFFQG